MLIGGTMASMWFMFGGLGGMMGGFGGMMGSLGVPLGFMGGFSLLGLISGIIVIIGATMLNAHPKEHITWGTIILVFSIVSLFGMGGFFIGAMLGIIGGALALAWRPLSKV